MEKIGSKLFLFITLLGRKGLDFASCKRFLPGYFLINEGLKTGVLLAFLIGQNMEKLTGEEAEMEIDVKEKQKKVQGPWYANIGFETNVKCFC